MLIWTPELMITGWFIAYILTHEVNMSFRIKKGGRTISGGHFNDCGYEYYKVAQFADELEAVADEQNGWTRYTLDTPDVVEEAAPQEVKRRRGRPVVEAVELGA